MESTAHGQLQGAEGRGRGPRAPDERHGQGAEAAVARGGQRATMMCLSERLRWPFHVRVHPHESVTSRSPLEEDPAAGGLSAADVDAIWRSVVRLYETGLHPAISPCVRRARRV